eukprot:CAMPEP_0118637278 /NCGR_PEP_ID=MMETSP0785-20121206/3068_1 /TAXON_ID=91992 /ORGANISM="Bolidomonas pacifica, Strain CCMP 1866" /LENGTH=342 /DNA_ID=CAMNT_0006528455 /DNA_START=1034 /DNA_END=2059 /DNA_ORIENTATION=+
MPYGPELEWAAARNYTCMDAEMVTSGAFQNNCPVMMACWYDESLGDANNVPTCHCSTIVITSQDDFPKCSQHSDASWLPIMIGFFNVLTCFGTILYGLWIIKVLHTLKQLQMNDITQALVLSIAGIMFVLIHQITELAQMFLLDPEFHEAAYTNGGILQICLAGLGLLLVLASLKIPLLWIVIASSGMDKAAAAKNKAYVTKLVRYTSCFFLVTFLGIMVASGTTNGGSYALLWMLILIVSFQIGSRKLRKKLHKPGEEMPKAVQAMRHYVRRWTASVFFYLLFIVMFIMNTSKTSANPRGWSHWAGLIYHALAQLYVSNIVYIRATLEKKLAKFKDTGKVM